MLEYGALSGALRIEPPTDEVVDDRRMKRWFGCFLGLMLFGAVVWGTADEMRNRPEWRQWLLLAFWAVIAAVILNFFVAGAYKEGANDMDAEWERRLNRWLEEGVLLDVGENRGVVDDV